MAVVTIRFDLRVPGFAPTDPAGQYAACLDMAGWADDHGVRVAVLSEHHGADDGFLPAPLTLAAAILGRTRTLAVSVSALLVPLHDPVRLAEELAVLDLVSHGRINVVAGLGYRDEEFAMAGVTRRDRVRLLEEHLDVMRRAWTGEPFEWRGRTVRVTPRPFTRPHPLVMMGGSTDAAARRAARLHLPFFPAVGDPDLAAAYHAACADEGFDRGWVILPKGPGFVYVSDDPDRDWARIAPFARYDAAVYSSWQRPGQRSAVHVHADTVDELRASGVYRVVTPDECVALADELGPTGALVLHPLLAGMPPELGWAGLELFAKEVLPRLAR